MNPWRAIRGMDAWRAWRGLINGEPRAESNGSLEVNESTESLRDMNAWRAWRGMNHGEPSEEWMHREPGEDRSMESLKKE
jgi:hypothetical protein